MRDTAVLPFDVPCPSCLAVQSHLCHLQWGAVRRDLNYAVGDEVEWLRDSDGAILRPFLVVNGRWNCGDPTLRDVVIKDPTLLGGPLTCGQCGARYEGIAVEIAGGRFRSARYHRYDELGEADHFERLADGTLRPHPEWLDAQLEFA
jgi:hypothetical protein